MAPVRGSKEYDEQVATIVIAVGNVRDLSPRELNQLLMGYITDLRFSRTAIAEAEGYLRRAVELEKLPELVAQFSREAARG